MKAIVRKKQTPARGGYKTLLNNIGSTIETARSNAAQSVNAELVKANWEIGRYIVQYEQRGKERAEYGSELLDKLSRDLKIKYGKGFSRRNVSDMRRFFIAFPIWQPVAAKLSWTHHAMLLAVSNKSARNYYMKLSIQGRWSKRELERHIDSSLYERVTLNHDKKYPLSRSKHIPANSDQLIKDPYVLDFLNITQSHRVTEKQLEQKIIDNLQSFLLELGKGFAFIGRQYKISIGRKHFYVDLVFYHRILKCFVLVDLKIKPVSHTDIGQMNLYLNYFRKEEAVAGDGEPIGIILSADKDDILVEYATGGISNKIFVSKYQLYLPHKRELKSQVQLMLPKGKNPEPDRK